MTAITAWRITQQKHAQQAFNGDGARLFAGRWNSRGIPVAYTASSQSLAKLELLVHLENEQILRDAYVLFQLTFPEEQIRVLDGDLPDDWTISPPPLSTRAIGDDWIKSQQSLVLEVPSVVTPGETNYLINPAYPSAVELLTLHDPVPLTFDPRLLK
ncbi:MAG: RES family NAD+ phosphorylase [Ectothiorhodospiraceae bacterium]|nr:RES family NAD+ phosphorylase [Ectothiorhodospiraceae bacterium]